MSRQPSLVLVLLLVSAMAACRDSSKPPRPIVLITLDTARADHLGCYGYFRDTSPTLDELAREGVLFENVFTPMSATLPSHVSMFTGVNPRKHGVLGNFSHFKKGFETADQVTPLAVMLRRAGYETAAVIGSAALRSITGIAEGFDSYDEPDGTYRRAKEVTTRALEWLDAYAEAPSGPFFLWLHFFDPHLPYDPPVRFANAFEDDREELKRHFDALGFPQEGRRELLAKCTDYDREIRYTDAMIERFLAGLRERGLDVGTTVVVVGDHGEGLGQHGWPDHGEVYGEELHVPFLVRFPDDVAARGLRGVRVAATGSVIDLVPTLAAALDLPLTAADFARMEGVDLLAGEDPERFVFSERVDFDRGWGPEIRFSLTGRDWKYYHEEGRRDRLFYLPDDPYELDNVARENRDVTDRLGERLEGLLERYAREGPALDVDPETSPEHAEELHALGYGG